jgi:hypothetical protein
VVVVQVLGSGTFPNDAFAPCPADHPYILGGGGAGIDPTTDESAVAPVFSGPNYGGNAGEGTDEGEFVADGDDGAWVVDVPAGFTATAFAICAK